MECIYCNAELEWYDSYGNREYIIYGDETGKRGDILICPNSEGFETEDIALEYAKETGQDTSEIDNWEDIVCDSSIHSVCGSYYTDTSGNLHEGYPC